MQKHGLKREFRIVCERFGKPFWTRGFLPVQL
uniref:Uncharacterized protein n=1 Tax=Rhizophora mucronata TaxID=61149 RepID=A0A2P2IRY2_RHIMU